MATPRKHWFRVADSVAHEPWSNDVCATFTRLLAHLNTRWAREGRSADQACEVLLSRGTAMQLTGSGSLARARSILRELATSVTLVIDEQGTNTLLRWPKFAKFQRLESESGAEAEPDASPALPSPQDAPAPAIRKTERKEEPTAVAVATGAASPAGEVLQLDQARAPSPEAVRLFGRFMDYMRECHPAAKSPATEAQRSKWRADFDRMLRGKNARQPEDLESAIDWLQLENPKRQYAFVVQCPKTLDEKLDRIRVEMARQRLPLARAAPKRGFGSEDDWAAYDRHLEAKQ